MEGHVSELVFILYENGSMSSLVSHAIGGFHAMQEKQKIEIGKFLENHNGWEVLFLFFFFGFRHRRGGNSTLSL